MPDERSSAGLTKNIGPLLKAVYCCSYVSSLSEWWAPALQLKSVSPKNTKTGVLSTISKIQSQKSKYFAGLYTKHSLTA